MAAAAAIFIGGSFGGVRGIVLVVVVWTVGLFFLLGTYHVVRGIVDGLIHCGAVEQGIVCGLRRGHRTMHLGSTVGGGVRAWLR